MQNPEKGGEKIMRFCRSLTRRSLITAAAAMVIGGAGVVLPGQAWAQSFHINQFSCTTTPLGVHVDVGGVGNTDLCVTGSATVDLDCACVGGGGNCPTDAKKQTIPTTTSTSQTLQPRNGKVVADVSLPISLTDASCTAPTCGSGQTTKLIKWVTEDSEPTFTVCIAGPPDPTTGNCTCDGAAGDLPETINCGPETATPFPGKKNSCSSLFP
jgi:hypothetical protein